MSKPERQSTKTKVRPVRATSAPRRQLTSLSFLEIYEFLSRSSSSRSRSRSRSKSASGRAVSNDPSPSRHPPHPQQSSSSNPAPSASRPATRSPSRPLSANTSATDRTITQSAVRAQTPRIRPPPIAELPHPTAQYDPRMPPPPVPPPQKKKPPTLFGISFRGRSRPPTPNQYDLTSPPQSPRRGRQVSDRAKEKTKLEQWFTPRLFSGACSAPPLPPPPPPPPHAEPRTAPARLPDDTAHSSSAQTALFAPQPRRLLPHAMSVPTTPTAPRAPPLDDDSEGRCSPLLRMFGVKSKERARDRPVVSVPILRARTRSRDETNPPPRAHGSFEFERPAGARTGTGTGAPVPMAMQRSVSHGGAVRARRPPVAPSAQAHHHVHAHAHARAGAPASSGRGHAGKAHAQTTVHGYSTSHGYSARTHPPQSPLVPHATGASGNSQSTGATGTTQASNHTGGVGNGSWGRRARAGWVQAGMHPPFEFESAVSGRGSPVSEGRAMVLKSKGEKERERRKESKAVEGRWERRSIELGLGLAWAPSKIRVREWPGGERGGEKIKESDLQRAREMEVHRVRVRASEEARREHDGEHGRERARDWTRERERPARSPESRRGKKDKETTGRFRVVLGETGFEACTKCERTADASHLSLLVGRHADACLQTCDGTTRT